MSGEPRARVRIPADTDKPDKLLANLTARQLAILAVAGVVLWVAYTATRHVVPLAAFAAAACPFGAVSLLLALGHVEGLPADRLVAAAWRQLRAPHRLVVAPSGVRSAPAVLGVAAGPLPSPLRLPFGGITDDGIVDLGTDGLAVVCRASSVTFALRTPAEQEALVAGFARFLNALTAPVQLLVRAEPVDLDPMVRALLDAAPGLPHPGLDAAARDHAAFLADLGARRTLLRREVLVVLREPRSTGGPAAGAADRLRRRAEEAVRALAAAGVVRVVLDGDAASACLVRALDPSRSDRPAESVLSGAVVTRSRHREARAHREAWARREVHAGWEVRQ
jgi:hypothetical protein